MLITFVQGIVRSFDKHLAPLDEGSGEKSGERAKNDFLGEGCVHPVF
jgi:hypothetical protein